MSLEHLKEEMFKQEPKLKVEYDLLQEEYDLKRAILEARKKANMTQQQLADITGIDRADISKLENGNTNPTVALLQRIAEGMNMKLKLEFVPNYKK